MACTFPPAATLPKRARVLGKDALIGLSIQVWKRRAAVDAKLVDYVIAGPVFETQSKPGYGPALGRKDWR